jgi:hypothetical protein
LSKSSVYGGNVCDLRWLMNDIICVRDLIDTSAH